jgi:ubiquinone/menaquinone biosynthesis C-methylase UbiE
MDPTKRFSSKAQVYDRYRPNFAPEAITDLKEAIGFPNDAAVLDVGAGTGMLARLLLLHFDTVFALEPNPEMRATATQRNDLSRCGYLAARAEAIPLTANSVDLITAGRVVHWLQPEPTRAEFRRIAKPGAWLAIARLRVLDDDFLQAMRTLRTPENGFRTRETDPMPGDIPLEFYFANEAYQTITRTHTHRQNFDAFLGGLQSGSYAPDRDHPRYQNFLRAAREAFKQLSHGGIMKLQLTTEIHYGKI